MPRRCRSMHSYPTDAELLARSVAEPAVYGEPYERHSLAVRRYVVRRIGDAAGDDVAAEVGTVSSRITRARRRLSGALRSPVPVLAAELRPNGDTHV